MSSSGGGPFKPRRSVLYLMRFLPPSASRSKVMALMSASICAGTQRISGVYSISPGSNTALNLQYSVSHTTTTGGGGRHPCNYSTLKFILLCDEYKLFYIEQKKTGTAADACPNVKKSLSLDPDCVSKAEKPLSNMLHHCFETR